MVITMSQKLIYDFGLSKSVADNLREIADTIDTDVVKKLSEDETLFTSVWNGENADAFFVKYKKLIDNYKLVKNELLLQTEEIEKTSRHMFLIEQEAKEIATEKN